MAKHCAGGVILGFEQLIADDVRWTHDIKKSDDIVRPLPLPTPWNQLEAGILFSLGLPMLVFKETGVSGGVFDLGTAEMYIHQMPAPRLSKQNSAALHAVFMKWQTRVRQHYYGG